MLRAAATVAFAAALTIPVPVDATGGDGISDGGSSTFHVWVIGSNTGGIRPPRGTTCTSWRLASGVFGVGDVELSYTDSSGMKWRLFGRYCGREQQLAWVPDLDPEDLAELYRDDIRERLRPPVVTLTPPAGAQVVNLETWLAVTPQADIVRFGAIPGLSVTVRAWAETMEWLPDIDGAIAAPGGRASGVIVCEPWGAPAPAGAAVTGSAPCGWTPPWTGTTTGAVTIVWRIVWVASDGTRGELEPLAVSSTYPAAVDEIVTIGQSNTSGG